MCDKYHFMSEKQKEKLRELLLFLRDNNEYFAGILTNNGIDFSEDIMSIYSKLPIIHRKEIQQNYSVYITPSDEEIVIEATSGTSGMPLKCIKSYSERNASCFEIWKERKNRDPEVKASNFIYLLGDTYNAMGDFCNFNEENMKNCFDKLSNLAPRWVCGPISVIERCAQLVEKGAIKYKNSFIKYIELQGEYADSEVRKYIEEIFNCETINHYGNRECWCIAYECKEKKMHILDELFFVETQRIENNEDKKFSNIIITSLYNRLMPIVRYNTEDFGTVKKGLCKCGKNSPVLTLTNGRSINFIKGHNNIVGDIFFKRLVWRVIKNQQFMGNLNLIDGFRVEQINIDQFIIYIIKGKHFSDKLLDELINLVDRKLGYNQKIEIKFVNEINVSASGKAKIFKCLC